MSPLGQTQLPPTACTWGAAAKSARLAGPTPPVGMNFTPPKGPDRALRAERPPYTLAGKNLSTFRPCFRAAMISVGVTQPGVTGMPCAQHQLTTSSS